MSHIPFVVESSTTHRFNEPKLTQSIQLTTGVTKGGSCAACARGSDCQSGHCAWSFKCSGQNGLMDNECSCFHDVDCRSLRCEGSYFNAICEAKLGIGARCTENSDCLSSRCSWAFKCAKPLYGRNRQRILLLDQWSRNAKTDVKWGVLVIGCCVVAVAFAAFIITISFRRFRERRNTHEYERILGQQFVSE